MRMRGSQWRRSPTHHNHCVQLTRPQGHLRTPKTTPYLPPIYIPPAVYEGSTFPHSCQYVTIQFFSVKWYFMVALICIPLINNDQLSFKYINISNQSIYIYSFGFYFENFLVLSVDLYFHVVSVSFWSKGFNISWTVCLLVMTLCGICMAIKAFAFAFEYFCWLLSLEFTLFLSAARLVFCCMWLLLFILHLC